MRKGEGERELHFGKGGIGGALGMLILFHVDPPDVVIICITRILKILVF